MPERTPKEHIDKAFALVDAGKSVEDACAEAGISQATYHRRRKRLNLPVTTKRSSKVEVVSLPNPVTPNAAPVSLALTGEPEAVARFLGLLAGGAR